jgi:RHS repeat-associated protein
MSDGLGSIRNLVDGNEDAVNVYDYYAFGKELGSWTETVTNRYTYTAREYDEESEQYYYRTRLYSGAGRFLSRDIVETHRYVYAYNRPLMSVDPYGLYGRVIHLELTAAMAKYAGFTPSIATAVGGHNNQVDTYHDPIRLWSAARRAFNEIADYGGFEDSWERGYLAELEMLRWHFPQRIGDQAVVEGSEIARDRVKAWIERCDYEGFGKALHVFQDSFAHAGGPPLPLGWFIPHSYGHSWKDEGTLRPAWLSGDADDAWRRKPLARRMARASYGLIADFIENCHCDHPSWFDARKWPPRSFDDGLGQFQQFWAKPSAREPEEWKHPTGAKGAPIGTPESGVW